jgi:predicted nucleic acid-binding protein
MIVFDTNVLSELMGDVPNERVLNWAQTLPKGEWFTTPITRAEIFFGVEDHSTGGGDDAFGGRPRTCSPILPTPCYHSM